ncbi:uncharacterized protein LOC120636501 [Pararge aegeria]|uniref:uncharacterized protein LOC120636501 n=1 Tax=Pararge aegeria TaxID=116150 RepID=UPI0019D2ACB3|nr:uncharacterized protein LOC120636501 [Pararge aegeria]
MYRQCLVHEEQRDLQLILWRDDPTQPLSIYRLNTVTYGTASAPCLSVRCLKQLANDSTNADVRRIINEDFYVDDMITGSDNKYNLMKLCEETSTTLRSGCFPLRKWIFNFTCNEFEPLIKIPTSTSPRACKKLTLNENSSHKTLGIGWLNDSDEFYFNTEFESDCNQTITKRKILSYASQIFDPIGILSPFILTAKMLLQQLWLLKLEWDDTVPNDIARQWNRFLASLPTLKTIRVPRYVKDMYAMYTEMHIFTDASQLAYGACIYIRSINTNNQTATVRLLCSKGKVAPLKTTSIPRLELLGALVGARLYDKMSSDPNDLLPLSPAHFLVGRPLTAPACDNLVDTPTHKLDRYQRVEQIRQHFWTRWAKEYLSELQTRTKCRENTQDLKPNTLVIIKEDNFPPLRWHLGRVVRNIPGKDGVARVAELQTTSGLIRRAYTKLCPLVDPDEHQTQTTSEAVGSQGFQGRGHV